MSSEIKQFKVGNLLKEIVTLALYEQEQMGAPAAPAAAAAPPPPPNMGLSPQIPDPNMPDPNAPPPGDPGTEELTLDTMIERLNVIRGGKSFTDPEIYGQLTSYFKTMQPEQKSTIDTFLQSVSKIMIDVRQGSGAEAQDPNQAPMPDNSGQPPIVPQATPQPAPQPNAATPPQV